MERFGPQRAPAAGPGWVVVVVGGGLGKPERRPGTRPMSAPSGLFRGGFRPHGVEAVSRQSGRLSARRGCVGPVAAFGLKTSLPRDSLNAVLPLFPIPNPPFCPL